MTRQIVVALAVASSSALVTNTGINSRRKADMVSRRGIDVNAWDYTFDNQDPRVALPAGVVQGSDAQSFTITDEQRETLERDGVVHIKNVLDGGWLEHLRTITDHQVAHPHIWASPGVASGLYDYIQRNVWSTNEGFCNFLYHSPVSTVLAELGGATQSVRVTTDLLMVNPNKGFKWHQDNQNGPVSHTQSLRFWVTMDDTPADYGAPVYLRASHENDSVDEEAVFVDLAAGDLPAYATDQIRFLPKAGDMIVWHPRTIHKIDGPDSADWGAQKRRVLGGTVALDGAIYQDKQKVEFADMGRHSLKQGDSLADPHFPQIWPRQLPDEVLARTQGQVGRSMPGFARMLSQMFSFKTVQQFASWGNVLKDKKVVVQETADEETQAAR